MAKKTAGDGDAHGRQTLAVPNNTTPEKKAGIWQTTRRLVFKPVGGNEKAPGWGVTVRIPEAGPFNTRMGRNYGTKWFGRKEEQHRI